MREARAVRGLCICDEAVQENAGSGAWKGRKRRRGWTELVETERSREDEAGRAVPQLHIRVPLLVP